MWKYDIFRGIEVTTMWEYFAVVNMHTFTHFWREDACVCVCVGCRLSERAHLEMCVTKRQGPNVSLAANLHWWSGAYCKTGGHVDKLHARKQCDATGHLRTCCILAIYSTTLEYFDHYNWCISVSLYVIMVVLQGDSGSSWKNCWDVLCAYSIFSVSCLSEKYRNILQYKGTYTGDAFAGTARLNLSSMYQ